MLRLLFTWGVFTGGWLSLPTLAADGKDDNLIACQTSIAFQTVEAQAKGLPKVFRDVAITLKALRQKILIDTVQNTDFASLERKRSGITRLTFDLGEAVETATQRYIRKNRHGRITRVQRNQTIEVSYAFREAFHDLRKYLTPLQVINELSTEPQSAHMSAALDSADEAIDKAFRLAERIATGSPLHLTPVTVSPRAIIRSAVNIHKTPNVQIFWEAGLGLPSLKADELALSQALANLISNAMTAMEKVNQVERRIHLRAYQAKGNLINTEGQLETAVQLGTRQLGPEIDYIVFAVHDNGPGMPEDILTDIFTPEFTTGENEGQGLGLSSAGSVVERHDGFMQASSKVGKGSIFRIILPVSYPDEDLLKMVPAEPLPDRSVLVVDDQRSNRFLIARALEYSRLIELDTGNAAAETVRLNPGKVKLIFLDKWMPGLTMAETIREVKALDPSITIVIATAEAGEIPLDEPLEIVRKPFETLKLREILTRGLQ